MDAMLSETDDDERPVACNRVAGVLVTGNEDGAHHVISEIAGCPRRHRVHDPRAAWTYWRLGPGAGPDYLDSEQGREWSHRSGRAMASNLYAVAEALAARPIPAPPQ